MSALSPRSKRLRRRILEATRRLPAAHIAPAFSALEIVDAVYEKMRSGDVFVMSKDYGYSAQFAATNERVMADRSVIGSLICGLEIALADRSRRVYVLTSDGELIEGSLWEAVLAAANLALTNLALLVDNSDFVGMTRIRDAFPAFYPIAPKFKAFGWDCENANAGELVHLLGWEFERPVAFVCKREMT